MESFKAINLSIKYKFIIGIVLILIFATMPLSVVFIRKSEKLLIEALEKKADLINRNLSIVSAIGIQDNAFSYLQAIINEVGAKDKEIKQLVIAFPNRVIIASSDHHQYRQFSKIENRTVLRQLEEKKNILIHNKSKSMLESVRLIYSKPESLMLYGELMDEKDATIDSDQKEILLGFIYIVLDTTYMEESVWKLWFQSAILVIFMTVIGIVCAYLVGSGMTRPIKELADKASYISVHRDLEQRIRYQSNDELGILSSAFNEMIESLKSYYDGLQESNQILNKEIKERQKAEEKYRGIFENAVEGIFQSTPDGKFLNANPAFASILGYDSADDLIKSVTNIRDQLYVIPEQRDELVRLANEHERILEFETQFYRKEKSEVWISLNVRPVKDENGSLLFIEGMAEDITKRKEAEALEQNYKARLEKDVEERTLELNNEIRERVQTEKALRESGQRLFQIINFLPDATFAIDREKKVIFWNKAIEEMTEIKSDAMIGKGDYEYSLPFYGERRPILIDLVNLSADEIEKKYAHILRQGNTLFGESHIPNLPGGEKYFWGVASPLYDSERNVIGAIESVRDITYRKKTEDELREAKENLEKILQELRQSQAKLIQSEKMAALGQLIAGVAHEINTPLGAIRASAGNITDSLNDTLEQFPRLFRILSEDEQKIFFSLLRRSSENESNLSAKEERKLKRALIRILEEQEIGDADTVADTLTDMGVYDNTDEFLPLLRHPESSLILQTAYNLSGLQRGTENITTATDRASKTVFALKSYARFDHTGEPVYADLTEGIETVLTLYHNQLKHGIEVIRNYEECKETLHSSKILCYPDELNQVWTNLIHNAIQAMEGKGTLTIALCRKDDHVVITFTDTGKGIPPEIKDRVFEPFFTTKPAGEGSGLGLDIVRKIIEKHKGKIEVESDPGRTVFSVILPFNIYSPPA